MSPRCGEVDARLRIVAHAHIRYIYISGVCVQYVRNPESRECMEDYGLYIKNEMVVLEKLLDG